ncbi:16S rRNA (guanine(527)-N(7))-methyltransferase RsmG [Cyclobacterium xiamenense]|uniref:16S rRNA (guanine(527)-N(7))-methyltransferase RsmG n=1 Tax=Cyclobacterium xiamenense TaxID=1297121 RepID=UPI0035CF8B12
MDANPTLIQSYFPNLSPVQIEQFARLGGLYQDWNSKINVISRKDMEHFYLHHVLHSLGIARVIAFPGGSKVLDIGTGGGFPGIPLAILFPDAHFHLVDSIGKKISVVKDVVRQLGLKNIEAQQVRAENLTRTYHFIVSRAVTRMEKFYPWVQRKFRKEDLHKDFQNGVFYLKGGEVDEELEALNLSYVSFFLDDYFTEPFFSTKKVVYIPYTGKR